MGNLNYSDLVFIEQCLTYYSINGIRKMKKYPDIYSDEDIDQFRSSVQEIINKILKLKEGDKTDGIFSNWKRIFGLYK